jgi:hypothetical protein
MHKIVIEDTSQLELLRTHCHVEVCDSEGVTVGYFVSLHEQEPKLYQWVRSQLNDDQLQRRKNERGVGRITAEVLKRLETR